MERDDLFSSVPVTQEPLASRMRPRSLDEYIGQDHILGKGRLLRRAIQMDQLSSVIFYGPPGTGKTTLARVIANTTKSHFSSLNAVLSGVKELRDEIAEAKDRRDHWGMRTILFVDEVHRWNKSQQDALGDLHVFHERPLPCPGQVDEHDQGREGIADGAFGQE